MKPEWETPASGPGPAARGSRQPVPPTSPRGPRLLGDGAASGKVAMYVSRVQRRACLADKTAGAWTQDSVYEGDMPGLRWVHRDRCICLGERAVGASCVRKTRASAGVATVGTVTAAWAELLVISAASGHGSELGSRSAAHQGRAPSVEGRAPQRRSPGSSWWETRRRLAGGGDGGGEARMG